MKSISIAVFACSLLALVLASPARAADNSPTTKPSLEDENKALRSQVEAQRKQIEKLSNELRDREREISQLGMQLRTRLSSQLPQARPFSLVPTTPSTIPPGSVQKQFNGSPYYLVPLGDKVVSFESISTTNLRPAIPATPAPTELTPMPQLDTGCFVPQAK